MGTSSTIVKGLMTMGRGAGHMTVEVDACLITRAGIQPRILIEDMGGIMDITKISTFRNLGTLIQDREVGERGPSTLTEDSKVGTYPQPSCIEEEPLTGTYNVNIVNNKHTVNSKRIVHNINKMEYGVSQEADRRAMEIEEEVVKDEMVVKIVSWNMRSINDGLRLKRVLEERATFTLIQEIWQPKEMIMSFLPMSKIMKVRPKGQSGGGTLVLWNDEDVTVTGQSFEINQDSIISKYILAGNRFMWVSSIYLNKGTKEKFMEVIARIQEIVPETEWPYLLLCGDWNIDINVKSGNDSVDANNEGTKQKVKRMNMVKSICEQMKLEVKYKEGTRSGSTIDYVIHGSALKIEDIDIMNDNLTSDHGILVFNLKVKCPVKSTRKVRVPNRS